MSGRIVAAMSGGVDSSVAAALLAAARAIGGSEVVGVWMRLSPDEGEGYEDWYLVEGWPQLGELNAAAVDARRRAHHDRAASMVGEGWGGVYAHVGGPAAIPEEPSWVAKRPGQPLEEIVAPLAASAPIWRRQLVLGPAPEICVGAAGGARRRIA